MWCWIRLLRVPWTARRFNQSMLKEISAEYSLEGPMLKLNLQYFGQLTGRTDSFEKTLMQGKIKGRRQRGRQKMKLLGGSTDLMNMSLSKIWELVMDRETWNTAPHDIEKSWTWLRDWTELMYRKHQGTGRRLWGPVNPVALVGVGKDLGGSGGFPSSVRVLESSARSTRFWMCYQILFSKKKEKKKNLLSAGVRTLTESVL